MYLVRSANWAELIFAERGKPELPGEKPLGAQTRESGNRSHIGGRRVLSLLPKH